MQDKKASLTPKEAQVILNQATEPPNSSKFTEDKSGTYICRRCGFALYRSSNKFHCGCGWPSFDESIKDHIETMPDPDGSRTEMHCKRCHSHLGHVFKDEGFTQKNLRHCVNSLSLDFITNTEVLDTQEIILAGGCFWGIDHFMKNKKGVLMCETGYIGGHLEYPTYSDICKGNTGHFEAVRVLFDPLTLPLKQLLEYFFEIHDPTQPNGQGNDIGPQYQSAVFCYNDNDKETTKRVVDELKQKGTYCVTQILEASPFWPAEKEHQNYLAHNPSGYCNHKYVKRF